MTAEAVAESLALAGTIALSPPPVVAMVLVLTSRRARANGPALLLGWLLGLLAIGLLVLVVLDVTTDDSATKPGWRRGLELVAGVALLLLAVRYLRARPAAGEVKPEPAWAARLDTLRLPGAAGLGLALTVANPKNLLLAAGGAAVIAEAGLTSTQQLISYLAFMLVASLGVLAPLILALVAGERAAALLGGLKDWLGRHHAVIMSAVCAFLGVVLVLAGLTG